ncbi:MAG: beta-ketoacyl synthase chain length factor, partial [Pseudomonadota bacterium]
MTLTAYLGGACLAAEGVAPGDLAAEVLPTEAAPACLSPRQAKRLSPQIRLALAVAERLGAALPEEAAWVFASSMGEGETLNVILEALRAPDMLIQPTRFQNAVHNAAGGQWTIAAGLRGPVTSIAGYDETVGAGLL